MHMLLLDGLLGGVVMCAGADRRMRSACLLMSQPCAVEHDWVVDSPGMVITSMDMCGISCWAPGTWPRGLCQLCNTLLFSVQSGITAHSKWHLLLRTKCLTHVLPCLQGSQPPSEQPQPLH